MKTRKSSGCVAVLMALMAGASLGQSIFNGGITSNPQQVCPSYQGGMQTPDVQLVSKADIMDAILQLQMAMEATQVELLQNEVFQQQQYPRMINSGMGQAPQTPRPSAVSISGGVSTSSSGTRRNVGAIGPSKFSLCGAVTPDSWQTTMSYQDGASTPGVQLVSQANTVDATSQLQMALNALKNELSQNNIIQQQQSPLIINEGMDLCPQYPQPLVMPINGGGIPMPSPVPFPGASRGVGSVRGIGLPSFNVDLRQAWYEACEERYQQQDERFRRECEQRTENRLRNASQYTWQ